MNKTRPLLYGSSFYIGLLELNLIYIEKINDVGLDDWVLLSFLFPLRFR